MVGANGVSGSYAVSTETEVDSAEYPSLFLDEIEKRYVTPGVRSIAVYDVELMADSNATNTPVPWSYETR